MLRNNIPKELSQMIHQMACTKYVPLTIKYSRNKHVFESIVESEYITYTNTKYDGTVSSVKFMRPHFMDILTRVLTDLISVGISFEIHFDGIFREYIWSDASFEEEDDYDDEEKAENDKVSLETALKFINIFFEKLFVNE